MTADSLGGAVQTLAALHGMSADTAHAYMVIAAAGAAAVTHFAHLAINKWRAAGGIQGIKNFLKTGKTTNQ